MYKKTHGAKDMKIGAKDVEIGADVYEETYGMAPRSRSLAATVTRRGLWTEGNLGERNRSPAWRCIDGPLVVSVTYIFTRINKYESFKLFLQVHYVAKKEFS